MMSAEPDQKKSGYTVERFGVEGEPVVIIDGFSDDADRLAALGREAQFGPGGHHYPGKRAPAPSAYLAHQMPLLQSVLTDVFGMAGGAALVECNFSIVTTPPSELTPIQRLPHFDSTDPGYLALLHYLCDADAGGTAFYRHRATGFETISADRLAPYNAAVKAEVASNGLPPAEYFSDSTTAFERIGRVDAAFNRMVIYRGYRLHSGEVLKAAEIGQPGAVPRLTVNAFLQQRG